MSYVLRIQINVKLVNPSKESLMKLKKIIVNPDLHNLEMCYSTVEAVNSIKPKLNVSKIISPVTEKGSLKNIKIIERLLKVCTNTEYK
jgi:hypothetical protein